MANQAILEALREEKPYLRDKYGVLSIGLFGSYAKDMEGPESDIDLLVEFKEPRFEHLAGLQIYLENKFGKRVEVIRKRRGLSERFMKRIQESVHYA